jgi:hypothetical protein
VLKVPHGRREFFIESGGSAYGPAESNPVVELGLTELLRTRLGVERAISTPRHRHFDPGW